MYTTPGVIEMLTKLRTSFKIPNVTITAGDRIREDIFLHYEKTVGTILNLYGSTEMGAMAVSPIHQPVEQRATGALEPLPGISFAIKSNANNRPGSIMCKNSFGYLRYLDSTGKTIRSTKREWFNTKDLGRINEHQLTVLGRADHKINRNGVLLSYFEIENAIEQICPELQNAIVVKTTEKNIIGNEFVIVCKRKENAVITDAQLRQRCLAKLTRGMVPDVVEFVEAMPLLPNGKINRHVLHSQFNTRIRQQTEHA
jgi:acyl-coenzyme A synthetase/AMP-(fatty) acid ligase